MSRLTDQLLKAYDEPVTSVEFDLEAALEEAGWLACEGVACWCPALQRASSPAGAFGLTELISGIVQGRAMSWQLGRQRGLGL